MRYFIVTALLFLGVGSVGRAQSLADLKFTLPALEERFGMDYDVEGLWHPTAEMLAGLDLDQYEELRKVDEDVKIYDAQTGFHIQLYSVNKSLENYRTRYKRNDE